MSALYSAMDPTQLYAEELDYELSLRGVFNLNTIRQKTHCLREFLRCEKRGEVTILASRADTRDPTVELAICSNIISDVCRMIEGSEMGSLILPQCRSRLIHVVERIKRSKPDSPEGQTLAFELLAVAEARLVETPTPRVLPRRSDNFVLPAPMLPLAGSSDQIQRDQMPVGGAVGGAQRGRISELNPTVAEFEPRTRESVDNPFSPLAGNSAASLRASNGNRNVSLNMFEDMNEVEAVLAQAADIRSTLELPRSRTQSISSARVENISGPRKPARAFDVTQRSTEAARSERSGEGRRDGRNAGAENGVFEELRSQNCVSDRAFRDGRNEENVRRDFDQRAQYELFAHMYRDEWEAFRRFVRRGEDDGRVEGGAQRAPANRPERFGHDERDVRESVDRYGAPREREARVNFGDRYGDRGGQHARQHGGVRKTVPVHQWKVAFSGDGRGLSLHDFLSELRMLQRSEGVGDDELFASVVHLLTGRARLWYRSWYDTFGDWAEFVVAMKNEFLPPKYDYRLLTNISNRRQKQSETFAEYLTVMQSQFNNLAIRVDEQHKLSIIEENMLPKYAVAASTIDVVSLEQLSNVCRRVDYAYAKRDVGLPFEERQQVSRPVSQGRTRDVHEVEVSTNDVPSDDSHECRGATAEESELCALRRGDQSGRPSENVQRKCFNCGREGHNFADCKQAKTGPFCYRCGSRNFTNFTCKDCPKNGDAGSVHNNVSNPQPQ